MKSYVVERGEFPNSGQRTIDTLQSKICFSDYVTICRKPKEGKKRKQWNGIELRERRMNMTYLILKQLFKQFMNPMEGGMIPHNPKKFCRIWRRGKDNYWKKEKQNGVSKDEI